MAKITISSHDVLYNGSTLPAFARVYCNQQFVNDEGDTVPWGEVSSPNYVKQVAVTNAAGVATIAAFSGANRIDSTVDQNGFTLSTYALSLHAANGSLLLILYPTLRVPPVPTNTAWDEIVIFNQAHPQPPRHEYYDTLQINALISSMGGGNWGDIDGDIADQTDLQAALDAKVGDTGNETIAGIKTFSSSPIVPSPTTDQQAANKEYVDAFGERLFAVEFDGSPQTIDFGDFYYKTDQALGECMYECWVKLGTGSSQAFYGWSAGYGGSHAMLCNPYSGNFARGVVIIDATNATPIVVTTDSPHGYTNETLTFIRGVLGNTAANAEGPTITVLSPTTFSINGSVGNGSYTSGGIAYGSGSFGGSGVVSFGADDVPYEGQWAHSAVGVDMTFRVATMYYDGVPVGIVGFLGTRICPDVAGNARRGFMGGSDHSNFVGRLGSYRIFEECNWHKYSALNTTLMLDAFIPEIGFGHQRADTGSGAILKSNLLVDFYQPQQIVNDKSPGYPQGYQHAGRIRGSAYGILVNRSSYPSPQFVVDNDIPNSVGGTQTPQPPGKVYTPATPPGGALVFDSIQRANMTFSFDGYGGMGSTESGSLGVLPWIFQFGYTDPDDPKPFGILNEQFVCLLTSTGAETFARVNIAQTDLDIRVSRKPNASSLWGAGVSTGIMFRWVDDGNYCFAVTTGDAKDSQVLRIGQVVNSVVTAWTGNGTACPATWEVLRVLTKSDGTYQVFCDATSVVSNTNAQHAAGTSAGIALHGAPPYGVGRFGAGLRMRYRNFTVFANP